MNVPSSTPNAKTIPIDKIDPSPDQPRKRFDEAALKGLAASIAAEGIIEPIIVCPAGKRFKIIAGERRCRAATLAGLKGVPAIIREGAEVGDGVLSLIENDQREALGPIERASAYRRAVDAGLNQAELARRLGVAPATVSKTLKLLDLPGPVRRLIDRGELSPAAASELSRLDVFDRIAPHLADQTGMPWSQTMAMNITLGARGTRDYGGIRACIDEGLAGLEFLRIQSDGGLPTRDALIDAWHKKAEDAETFATYEAAALDGPGDAISLTCPCYTAAWIADENPDLSKLTQADKKNLAAAYDRFIAFIEQHGTIAPTSRTPAAI